MASRQKTQFEGETLTRLPYYNCKDIPFVHGRFNNLIGDNLHSKNTLEMLHSLYDLDILNLFNINIDPDSNLLETRLRFDIFHHTVCSGYQK